MPLQRHWLLIHLLLELWLPCRCHEVTAHSIGIMALAILPWLSSRCHHYAIIAIITLFCHYCLPHYAITIYHYGCYCCFHYDTPLLHWLLYYYYITLLCHIVTITLLLHITGLLVTHFMPPSPPLRFHYHRHFIAIGILRYYYIKVTFSLLHWYTFTLRRRIAPPHYYDHTYFFISRYASSLLLLRHIIALSFSRYCHWL